MTPFQLNISTLVSHLAIANGILAQLFIQSLTRKPSNPARGQTSAAGVVEKLFATATTAEGIISQKQSPQNPNMGYHSGATS